MSISYQITKAILSNDIENFNKLVDEHPNDLDVDHILDVIESDTPSIYMFNKLVEINPRLVEFYHIKFLFDNTHQNNTIIFDKIMDLLSQNIVGYTNDVINDEILGANKLIVDLIHKLNKKQFEKLLNLIKQLYKAVELTNSVEYDYGSGIEYIVKNIIDNDKKILFEALVESDLMYITSNNMERAKKKWHTDDDEYVYNLLVDNIVKDPSSAKSLNVSEADREIIEKKIQYINDRKNEIVSGSINVGFPTDLAKLINEFDDPYKTKYLDHKKKYLELRDGQ